jgi:hypothetical protein
MRSAGRGPDFRDRERKFLASPNAVEECEATGIAPAKSPPADFWRVRAEMVLDTFERCFQWKKPAVSAGIQR